ncbi:MAG: type IX secretion system sortase PorU [Bacteroidetes bacterium]|nr:type IX secretion system sortase PorU [Bacteroidota bacterium]
MKYIKPVFLLILGLSGAFSAFSQVLKKVQNTALSIPNLKTIAWAKPLSFVKQGQTLNVLNFGGVSYIESKGYLPTLPLQEPSKQNTMLKPVLTVISTQSLTPDEAVAVNKQYLTQNFDIIETSAGIAQKQTYISCKVVPLRLNAEGQVEKLVSYTLQWQNTNQIAIPTAKNSTHRVQSYASSSVLANGTWYKIGVQYNGVYKIDRNMMQQLVGNTNISSIDPRYIKIYGNGGEMLSESNAAFHYDDLNENAIFVQGGADGSFDNGDYILFYGQSPHKWNYTPGSTAVTRYFYNRNYYSDSTFYFLTIDNSSFGKRINPMANSANPVTNVVNTFDDFFCHEIDLTNPVTSGRELYGESFENTASYSFNFPFPYSQQDSVWLKVDAIGRSTSGGGSFSIGYPGSNYQVTFNATCADYDCDVAQPINQTGGAFFINSTADPNNSAGLLPLSVTLNNASSQSGWLNYLYANARRALTMVGSQMTFRDYRCMGAGHVAQYNIQSTNPIRVWNVTTPLSISEQQPTATSTGTYTFSAATDSLQQFIAFDGTQYLTPNFVGVVPNQNLHALQNVEFVIVAPPIFTQAAQVVGNLHAQAKYENLNYKIVTPDQIYNEFSSGVQDITAIRQFMRMLYKNSAVPPRYLLLYGTGSYRLKDRYNPTNTVFVPAFETYNSWSYTNSKTGDDFYGFLDDNEGIIDLNGNTTGGELVDIGIGRITVKNLQEANAVSNKIVQYYNRVEPLSTCCDQSSQNTPDWRNWICAIADNPTPASSGETAFLQQQETNMAFVQSYDPRYNIDKIYIDAYPGQTMPGGLRFPTAVAAINNRMAKGALVVGYSGHGGVLNLSHSDIIDINQIFSWTNITNMPLFFTATCEFSRFDDPTLESAGEDVLLNPNGAGIALLSTTRLAFILDGSTLGVPFYSAVVKTLPGNKRPTLGDITRTIKQGFPNYLHFALLGDPALTLSYPKHYTTNYKINSHLYTPPSSDTLSALGKYTVYGYVSDSLGNKLSNLNGTMYMSVYDKPSVLTTLNNGQNQSPSPAAYIINFNQQQNTLYRGKSTVTNGDFNFTFIVPKDIMYNYGKGKISYYFQNDTTDAAGYDTSLIVGGTSNHPVIDTQGPTINLYMNDNHFVMGGTTNQNPFIYALMADSSGINTSGSGIGHNITAILDANTQQEIILNDYYQADLNKYQTGKILYQMQNLSNGFHTLTLKAWDVLDNASTATTDFVVAQNAQVALTHVLNYPNPFTTSTNFFIEHNQACSNLNVEIQIYTISGKVVKTILQNVENEGFRTAGIHWDGRDDFGDKLARGVYIYKVIVKNSEGNQAYQIEKLVILN